MLDKTDINTKNVTRQIVDELVGRRFDEFPEEIVRLAKHCILDCVGVTLAGASDSGPSALAEELLEAGGNPEATIFGRAMRLPVLSAALINGTAAHALDYDDVNLPMSAHPSVVILPALLAIAEKNKASGRDVVESFLAGYEAAGRVGKLVAPSHYISGFHGTATIGTFAATAACAHLLKLSADQTENAFGIAATQSAGIRSMFGTDCKPLHAGKACHNGVLAVLLARRGFTSATGVLECANGFAATHSTDFRPEIALSEPEGGYTLKQNLFKYHAACYMTHSVADGIADLMSGHDLSQEDILAVDVLLEPNLDSVCNIQDPKSGLEMKFSARAVAAMTLIGVDTAKLSNYDARVAADSEFISALSKVTVNLGAPEPNTRSQVVITLTNGQKLHKTRDSGVPDQDLDNQERRLVKKFLSLTEDIVGPKNEDLVEAILGLEQHDKLDNVLIRMTPAA